MFLSYLFKAKLEGCDPARVSYLQKLVLNSNCKLQFACMKSKSLVITNQPYNSEFVVESYTHRSSHYGH